MRTESTSFSHISFPFKPPALVCLPSLHTHARSTAPLSKARSTRPHMHVHLQHRRITASFLSPWLWLSVVNGCEYTALWGLRKGSAQWSCQYFKQTPNGNGTRLLSPSSSGTKLSTILCSSSAKALELAPLICYFSNLVDDA